MTEFYIHSDLRAGPRRREAAVATAWPTLALTDLPAGSPSGGWASLGEGGIGGELPSGRKRTSPGGGILQLFFVKCCCSWLAWLLLEVVVPAELSC